MTLNAEYSLKQILQITHDASDRGFAEGLERGRSEVFDLILSELEKVRALSLRSEKPGLTTAMHVVRNTREALRLGVRP